MQSHTHTTSEQQSVDAPGLSSRGGTSPADFSGPPLPIEEVARRPDFPQCARGLYIEIRGFAGVVVGIVNQSIKIRSREGITQSFNANRLKTLYAPPERYEPPIPAASVPESPSAKPISPPRVYIANPDFSPPPRAINEFVTQPDFPQCVYGKHVDIAGFTGVVVEIVKGSLKVQPQSGGTRSYNAEVLRKLHGKP